MKYVVNENAPLSQAQRGVLVYQIFIRRSQLIS